MKAGAVVVLFTGESLISSILPGIYLVFYYISVEIMRENKLRKGCKCKFKQKQVIKSKTLKTKKIYLSTYRK